MKSLFTLVAAGWLLLGGASAQINVTIGSPVGAPLPGGVRGGFCPRAIDQRLFNRDFAALSETVMGRDRRLRDYVASNCLSSDQIRHLAMLYSNEQAKVDFVYFAMRFVFDPENYSQVGWAFINDATHADLDAFLARQGWGQPVLPQQPIIVSPQPVIVNPMPQQPVVVAPVPGYNGPIGCNMPMSQPDFEQLRRSIQSKGFESTKLDFAKTVTSQNCLTSAQVRSVVELFDFESSKLEYAKFAYGFVYDINNYFTVSEAFGFDSSTTDLMRHIERNRRN